MNSRTLYQEAAALREEALDLENKGAMLEISEEEELEQIKAEIRSTAMDLLEAAEHRLGRFDLDALHAATQKADLTKDQLSRIKLLAREFLFITLET